MLRKKRVQFEFTYNAHDNTHATLSTLSPRTSHVAAADSGGEKNIKNTNYSNYRDAESVKVPALS